MLERLFYLLEAVKNYLDEENALIHQNKLKEVLAMQTHKAKLWEDYLQCFDEAHGQKLLIGKTQQQVLTQMKQLNRATEENQKLIGEVLQSHERALQRAAQYVNQGKTTHNGYNRSGRLTQGYGAPASALMSSAPQALAINQVL